MGVREVRYSRYIVNYPLIERLEISWWMVLFFWRNLFEKLKNFEIGKKIWGVENYWVWYKNIKMCTINRSENEKILTLFLSKSFKSNVARVDSKYFARNQVESSIFISVLFFKFCRLLLTRIIGVKIINCFFWYLFI